MNNIIGAEGSKELIISKSRLFKFLNIHYQSWSNRRYEIFIYSYLLHTIYLYNYSRKQICSFTCGCDEAPYDEAPLEGKHYFGLDFKFKSIMEGSDRTTLILTID